MSEHITITRQYSEIMALANFIAGVVYATGSDISDLHEITVAKLKAVYPSLSTATLSEMALSIISTSGLFYQHIGSWYEQEGLH